MAFSAAAMEARGTGTLRMYTIKSTVEDAELVERRRTQIVAAATKLFASHGFFRTTIKDIASAAGISQGLIYQYVSDKEDVLLLVLLDVLDGYSRELPLAITPGMDPFDRCLASVRAYVRVVDKRRKATVLAYRSSQSLSENRRALLQNRETETNRLIAKILEDCIADSLIRPVDVDVLTYQLVIMAHAWALKYWYFKPRMTAEDYVERSLDIFFRGALTEAGEARWRQSRASGFPADQADEAR